MRSCQQFGHFTASTHSTLAHLRGLFCSHACLVTASTRDIDKAPLNFSKQSRGQRAIIAAVGVERPQVRSWPGKPIALVQNNPRSFFIQPQPIFHRRWNLNGSIGIRRRRVGDGQNTHDGGSVLKRCRKRQNQTGPVLVAFFSALKMLPMPEISITQNVTGFNVSRQHACQSLTLPRVRH